MTRSAVGIAAIALSRASSSPNRADFPSTETALGFFSSNGYTQTAPSNAPAYEPTDDEIDRVNEWVRFCSVAWIVTEDAAGLEDAMKLEWKPPLTKI